jgi:hypothetical protein
MQTAGEFFGLFADGLYLQWFPSLQRPHTKHTGIKKTAHKTQTQFPQTESQMEEVCRRQPMV